MNEATGPILSYGFIVVEVKSKRAEKRALVQLNKHCTNLERGVKLGTSEYPSDSITISESGLVRVLVMSSRWKTSRELLQNDKTDQMSTIVYRD